MIWVCTNLQAMYNPCMVDIDDLLDLWGLHSLHAGIGNQRLRAQLHAAC
jgi:hypothetical protein